MGLMKLSDYMTRHELDDAGMAERIGDCSVSGVKKWRRGDRTPRRDHLRRIARATGGEVTANDFIEPQKVAAQ